MNALIKKFSINKLYGYKNITLDFFKDNTIVISENGTGKTTFISALYFVLNGDAKELSKIECESMDIEFYNNENYHIDIKKLKDNDLTDIFSGSRLFRFTKQKSMQDEIFDFVRNGDLSHIDETNWYNFLIKRTPLTPNFIINEVNRFMEYFLSLNEDKKLISNDEKNPKEILFIIRRKMRAFDIIYLPTYRRVEKSTLREELGIQDDERGSNFIYIDGEVIQRGFKRKPSIEFGLFDVEQKLKELSTKIERKSSVGYRALSASMIEDIMTDELSPPKKTIMPETEDLSRFLNRVVTKETEAKNDNLISQIIEKTKNLREVKKEKPLLVYFLNKLNDIIDSTKELESTIESFVTVCNNYLKISDDSKTFTFDIERLHVVVKDNFTKKNIKLEDLSSGEKQIISIMAHFYLDDSKRKKILLIDEPELSLSTEWQAHILEDIANSENLNQMLAITHSPFIFNNNLKKNVRKLKVQKIELKG